MNMAKRFADIKSQAPVSAEAKTLAHLENLAEDAGVPLPELRRLNDLTQVELARRLAVTQPSVSEIERSESPAIPTVRRYVEAIGAHLEITAVFDDGRRILLDV
jgi:predicted transcriptional regulator